MLTASFVGQCCTLVDPAYWAKKIYNTAQFTSNNTVLNLKKQLIKEGKMQDDFIEAAHIEEAPFDMAFEIALVMTIYAIVLIYSAIAPLIILFGGIFCTLKYTVDKYSLTYVYPRTRGGNGELTSNFVWLANFTFLFW